MGAYADTAYTVRVKAELAGDWFSQQCIYSLLDKEYQKTSSFIFCEIPNTVNLMWMSGIAGVQVVN